MLSNTSFDVENSENRLLFVLFSQTVCASIRDNFSYCFDSNTNE